MPSQKIGYEDFELLIQENHILFIDFWAAWCAPCKQFSQVYEKVSDLYPDIVFAKANIEEEKTLTEYFGILSIPHLVIIKSGVVIYSDAGTIPEPILKELVRQSICSATSTVD